MVPHRGQRRRQVVYPLGGNFRRHTQLAPKLPEIPEVGHVVLLKGVPQTLQPFLSHRAADVGLRDDWHERFDGTVDSRTYTARTAVDLFDGRRQLLQ